MSRPTIAVVAIAVVAIAACSAAVMLFHKPAGWVADSVHVGPTPHAPAKPSIPSSPSPMPQATADQIIADRDRLDQTVWSKEVKAQEYEESFVALWDAMRAKKVDQHSLLSSFPFDELTIRDFGPPKRHPWGIDVSTMAGESRHLDHDGWRNLVSAVAERGYRIEHCEFHHAAFDLEPNGSARSKMTMKLFMVQPAMKVRMVLSGAISVDWTRELDEFRHHVAGAIHATDMSLTARTGDDAFAEAARISPSDLGFASIPGDMDPILVYDIDHDGRDDILIPSLNRVLRNRSSPGTISFAAEPLFARPVSDRPGVPGAIISAGLVADLTGDGNADVLVCGIDLAPTLFIGDAAGHFPDAGKPIAGLAGARWELPMSVTAGDVDGDGLMDLWIGQYRPPYQKGNLPYPYWDAKDGPPSFLLMNNGNGVFRDATESSGLSNKRTRRNYSASMIDLDGDGDLDLVTINDFSGVDVFLGDGHGSFTDASDTLVDERSTFGMAHAIADFDGDGRIDIFVAGMGSTTARRLEYMKLGREEFPDQQKMRMKMGYGNRMLLGTAAHGYRQAPFNDQIARTGWSWGCTAFDVANDGNMSIYVANGQRSARTAKDYCSRYWTQDIYTAAPERNDELLKVFKTEQGRDQGVSWNGFEHKALLMNEGGKAFRDVAYPMALGFEWDGRSVVSCDFDGDGLMDLLVVDVDMVPVDGQPRTETVRIYRNGMPSTNHWIGVRLQDEPGHAPMGAVISVEAGGRTYIGVIVSGDSYRCQHPLCKHFGLGAVDTVATLEVAWADGTKTMIKAPAIDHEVLVRPPATPIH